MYYLFYAKKRVSIHAPYAGSDADAMTEMAKAGWFQSTPPMQGATPKCQRGAATDTSFNPRPLCRERHTCRNFGH